MDDERRARWDARYAARDHTDRGPNAEVGRILSDLPPGRAIDLGAGTGRHAIWLAGLGWQVTAVDFSSVGLTLGEQEARTRGLSVQWTTADARTWEPTAGENTDLVLVSHLHLPAAVLTRTTRWLAPGGHLVVLAHGERNLTDGVGGPSDPALLYSLEGLRSAAGELDVLRCEELTRPTPQGDAVDVVLVARSPA